MRRQTIPSAESSGESLARPTRRSIETSSVMGLYDGGDEAGAMGDDIVGGGDDTGAGGAEIVVDSDSGTVGAEIITGGAKIVVNGPEIVADDATWLLDDAVGADPCFLPFLAMGEYCRTKESDVDL